MRISAVILFPNWFNTSPIWKLEIVREAKLDNLFIFGENERGRIISIRAYDKEKQTERDIPYAEYYAEASSEGNPIINPETGRLSIVGISKMLEAFLPRD